LSNIESLSGDQYARWIAEIRDTIMYLHFNELVWGDAKLGNVLIHEDDRVVLIDFGGGHTMGWVDDVNSETVEGDWQGYQRIVQYLKVKVESQ